MLIDKRVIDELSLGDVLMSDTTWRIIYINSSLDKGNYYVCIQGPHPTFNLHATIYDKRDGLFKPVDDKSLKILLKLANEKLGNV